MTNPPDDTHPDIARLQIEMLRRATPEQKWDLINMLIKGTRELAWQGMRETHPELSEAELDILWLRVNYGPEIAERVRLYLAARKK